MIIVKMKIFSFLAPFVSAGLQSKAKNFCNSYYRSFLADMCYKQCMAKSNRKIGSILAIDHDSYDELFDEFLG